MRPVTVLVAFAAALACSHSLASDLDVLTKQVSDAETAFAATMARRDIQAFASHIAEDAVFFDNTNALRGKDAIVAGWKALYEGEKAPISWRPENVQVLDSGDLAHSSGPVFDPNGKRVGTFNSVWRREPDGAWRVVFDKACSACECRRAQTTGGDSQKADAK